VLRRAQEEATRRAVEVERSRIAGELHDVVTHNVSVMLIQAGAARKVMDVVPQEAKQALLAVEAGGRAAMAELRHVMGLLAGPDGEHPGDPADTLVDRVRDAGMTVRVTMSPPPGPLPAGVDLAAYRVVQEALTNTIKHAAGATVSVAVDCAGDWLEIEVTDTGGAAEARKAGKARKEREAREASVGSGRGLIGLRERLAVYGGTLDAGPRPGGGFRVQARLPWTSA
jgi:signal transduction histidine kinase